MLALKGTKTEKNILTAFIGESQARNRYTYFAKQAKKEGLEQICFIFEETANQEKEHAKRFLNFLENGELEITGSFSTNGIGITKDNLKIAAEGEKHEHIYIYPTYAEVAREEKFNEIAKMFLAIAVAERFHEKRYNVLYTNIITEQVFKRNFKVNWRCRNCGYIYESELALDKCPACLHSKAYFELVGENY